MDRSASRMERPGSRLERSGSTLDYGEPRAVSRAESRLERQRSSVGEPSRAESRLERQRSSLGGERPESRLQGEQRPRTARERMQERLQSIHEKKAEQEQQKSSEPDVDCCTKVKAVWMLFSTSVLPKVFVIVGVVMFLFGIVMIAIGFATDSFNRGKTAGPILAGVGLLLLLVGVLGLCSSFSHQRKVGQEPDEETQEAKTCGHETTHDRVNEMEPFEIPDSEKAKETSKPFRSSSRLERNSTDQGQEVPELFPTRPRTLPPLNLDHKPRAAKKKKGRTADDQYAPQMQGSEYEYLA